MAASHRARVSVRSTSVESSLPATTATTFLPDIHRTRLAASRISALTDVTGICRRSGAMKWQQRRPGEVRPFLVLPLLEGERSVSADPSLPTTKRNSSSGTSTGTWPPKLKLKLKKKEKQKSCDIERPLTATLERPELLNINLLDKLDMSLVRKEFLCITNLCKDTVSVTVVSKSKGRRFGKFTSPAISVTPSEPTKRLRKPETSEDSLESDENSSVRRSKRKITKVNKLSNEPTVKVKQNTNDANNNTDAVMKTTLYPKSIIQNRSLNRSKFTPLVSPKLVDDTLTSKPQVIRSSLALPEPCKTCGRPDAPERFHSHPATPLVRHSPRKNPPTPAAKSSVQKPVAIKYKSQPRDKSPQKIVTSSQTTTVPKTVEIVKAKKEEEREKMKGPRTVTCYLCGREFGTKSLPLHEPKCLQKWERENNSLPRHLQRKPPVKPEKPLTPEEWNKFAWEASQASLAPCENCGRTFLPDRLIVHQRSCKPTAHHRPPPSLSVTREAPAVSVSEGSLAGGTGDMPATPPGTVECYICGRMFGSHSIAIHEPQCLRKWHAQNAQLPPAQRRPTPVKPDDAATESSATTAAAVQPVVTATATATSSRSGRPPSGPRKPMLPCYICGREFGTSSIYIHEPQCLKKWRAENDKLPPHQRRKEPERPDIKFTPNGQVDYQATNDALWQSHLSQLVPCKMCGRTFNPDRVVVHERSCKGQ